MIFGLELAKNGRRRHCGENRRNYCLLAKDLWGESVWEIERTLSRCMYVCDNTYDSGH